MHFFLLHFVAARFGKKKYAFFPSFIFSFAFFFFCFFYHFLLVLRCCLLHLLLPFFLRFLVFIPFFLCVFLLICSVAFFSPFFVLQFFSRKKIVVMSDEELEKRTRIKNWEVRARIRTKEKNWKKVLIVSNEELEERVRSKS